MKSFAYAVIATVTCALAACGDDAPSGTQDAAPMPMCGDGVVDGTDECDDGNNSDNDACGNDCRSNCGDGEVSLGEVCDTGIAAGLAGSCPSDCDDATACTTDTLSGTACLAQCVHGAVGAFVDGDGCCPPGANINNDSDCPAGCGNGVVEPGETCDTGLTAGMIGACVTDCNDGLSCTTDALQVPAACQNACAYTEITAEIAGDGCCPALATSATDVDCSASCGDGVVQAGETCDTNIAFGQPGACPTSCNDSDTCTTDLTLSEGTCNAACSHTGKTVPQDGDNCCPPAANANNDDDCSPVCGNGVLEGVEECDDGDAMNGDGCDDMCRREPTAYRLSHMEIRDPHILFDQNCSDINSTVNDLINASIEGDQDSPPDGFLDLNAIILFRPLDQAAVSGPIDMDLGASCSEPASGGIPLCVSQGGMVVESNGMNVTSGMCLETLPGTTNPGYAPPTTVPLAPCFFSDAESLDVDFQTFFVHLDDARMAGTYVGLPATDVVDGLIRGFISQTQAEATILPATLPLVGGKSLADLLAGGGACPDPLDPLGVDDRDVGPDGVTMGWYFYINFTATRVPYMRI